MPFNPYSGTPQTAAWGIDPEIARINAQLAGQQTIQNDRLGFERDRLGFDAAEAERNRAFQGGQAGLDRDQAWRSLLQTQGFTGDQNQANRSFQGAESALDRDQAWRTLLSQQGFTAGQAAEDRAFTGGQNQSNRDLQLNLQGMADSTARRGQDISLQQAQLPWQHRQGIFDRVFPMIQNLSGGIGGEGGPGGTAAFQQALGLVGGQNTALPALPSSTVYDPQMIERQINAGRSQNDNAATFQTRRAAEDLASRGYAANSPLAIALNAGITSGASAANSDLDRETRMAAAEANAKQGLAVGGLANQQWGLFNQADIDRRRSAGSFVQGQQGNALQLIAALAGLAG